jgi:hypothetical protein
MSFDGDITITFEDPELNKIVEENLTESTKEEKAIDMVNAVEQQLNQFEISEEGLANARLLLNKMTKWYGENAEIIEDGEWLFAEKEKKTWQTKLEETIGKISDKIALITLDVEYSQKKKRKRQKNQINYNALMRPLPGQEGGKKIGLWGNRIKKSMKRLKRKRRKTRKKKRKRKKSRKKRKRRRRRTRK